MRITQKSEFLTGSERAPSRISQPADLAATAVAVCFTHEFRDALVNEGVEEFQVWTVVDPEDARFFQQLGAWASPPIARRPAGTPVKEAGTLRVPATAPDGTEIKQLPVALASVTNYGMTTSRQRIAMTLSFWLTGCISVCLPLAHENSLSAQMIVAHRGASHDAPENTLAAFRLAWEQEADGIEGDFRLTRDGHIVCIHDETTERTAGTNLEVAASTLAELRQLDVGTWKAPEFVGERIPLLSEVIATVPAGKRIVIELKTGLEIVAPLARVLADSGLQPEQILVISFDEATIAGVKQQLPHLRTHWLSGYEPDDDIGPWNPTAPEIAAATRRAGADGFGSEGRRSVFTHEFRDALASEGVEEFHVWTVDEPADARFFQELGAWAITTNRPALIRQALGAKRR